MFIGCALVWFAGVGRISWLVPVAVAGAVGTYVRDSSRRGRTTAPPGLARSRLGHAAGVANYALVGLCAGAFAAPVLVTRWVLDAGAVATAALNAVSALRRVLPRDHRSQNPHSAE